VLSARFDGVGDPAGPFLPNALVNASGVAALDEEARRLAGLELPHNVVIAYLNGEECGFTGVFFGGKSPSYV